MNSEDRYWNRDELYQEVWSTPMWTLAKKYGISDVGLAKVCRKLTIPVPGRGYWARKQAGQKVSRPALPSRKDKVMLEKPSPPKEELRSEELGTQEERAQLARLDGLTGGLQLKRGSLSYPLILQARNVLARASADGRGILRAGEECLDIRVSKGSLDRAIRIMAALIEMMEAEGFNVSLGNAHREQTAVMIYGEMIEFGLVEKVDRIEVAAAPRGSLVDRVLTYGGKSVSYEPAGRLAT